jgi:ketosteroid isomerase-like protein
MSREDVEIVVRQFDCFNARDFDAVVAAWAEDVTLLAHGSWEFVVPGGPELTGKEAVAKGFADYFALFGRDYQAEIDEIHDLRDRVVIVATDRARGRTSGAPITAQLTYVFTVRDRKISAVEIWDDRRAALEAVGQSE